MPRLLALALIGAVSLAPPALAQDFWRCADPECSLIEPGPPLDFRQPMMPASPWEPRHEPWLTPQWSPAPAQPTPVPSRREWLAQHDARAWYGAPRQAWHADDDRRHGRWRGNGLFD